MKILVFDFETTGLIPPIPFLLNRPEILLEMPHAVQLSFSVWEDEHSEYNFYLKVPVNIDNSDIHGVTKEISDAGVDFSGAFKVFVEHYQTSDRVVAHNFDFDVRILRIECARRSLPFPLDVSKHYCTMLEGAKVWGSKKWPKLEELYRHFYGKTLTGMHDATIDVKACLRCYGALTCTPVPSAEALQLTES
jgi:DNA polymerase-3 subunit epsilon